MSRLRLFIHSVASSYVLMLAATVYTLASVPLALVYLSKEEFGLWALIVQLSGYLELIDLGMSGAIARYLVDHKDRPAEGRYGSLIQTGALVLTCQGLAIFVIGYAGSPVAARLLHVPLEFQGVFVSLLRWQCGLMAARFATRILGQILFAHQRNDVTNYAQVGLFVASFVVLWASFACGNGLFSLIWANAAGTLLMVFTTLGVCLRLRVLPPRGCWGQPNRTQFIELFRFGRDIFLIAIGTQLVLASQNLILTRCLGLGMVAIWTVGTKAFSLVCQLLWRTFDLSEPAFMEMIVRGEREQLRHRFRTIVTVLTAVSGAAAVVFAVSNSAFVEVWTYGKIAWPAHHNVLLAVWMIILVLSHCHCGFVLATKQVGPMRYVYLGEGLAFVVGAGLLTRRGGLDAMVLVSMFCAASFSLAYGIYHTSRYLGFPWREVAWDWQKPLLRVLAVMLPAGLIIAFAGQWLPAPMQLVANIVAAGAVGLYAVGRWGVPAELRGELTNRSPRLLRRPLGWLFGARVA